MSMYPQRLKLTYKLFNTYFHKQKDNIDLQRREASVGR